MVRSREAGKVIPRWQAGRFPVFRGELFVEQEYRKDLHRHVLTARMRNHDPKAGPAPPELWDCRIVYMRGDRWVFTGFERIDDGLNQVDFAQTWVLIQPRGEGLEETGRTGYPGPGEI